MRLLHVTDTFLPKIGGAEIAIDSLVRAMNELGAQCEVLAPRQITTAPEIRPPYPLHRFTPPRSVAWAGWWIRRHIRQIERDEKPFDVFIGHHAFPPGYAVTRHAAGQRPSIVHVRGGDIYHGSRFRKKPFAWRKLRWALQNASAVVCLSTAMQDLVKEIIGPDHPSARADRILRIPNGIHLDALRANASNSRFASDPDYQASFVLGLGRTIRRKGFHLLIEAFDNVKDRHPDWRLVIAGDGRELDNLKQQATDRVLFTGLVEGPDKRWLLQNCCFVCTPSLEESFPNVALESLACGKPVIGSNTGGFPELIRDRENGRLIEVGNVAALAEALDVYMRADLINESRAASETAEKFSWPRVAEQYLSLIHGLVA